MADALFQALTYAAAHRAELLAALQGHALLVGLALGAGLVIAVPLGLATAHSTLAAAVLVNGLSALRVIPSLAVLFLTLPFFGLSITSAAIALVLLAVPPILINTDTGLRQVDRAVVEAARGMGMSGWQVLRQIELPLALPVMVAGIRLAAVETIASATLAAFIGGGGFGVFIILGFALYDTSILLVGAIPVALAAVAAELGLGALQRALRPPAG